MYSELASICNQIQQIIINFNHKISNDINVRVFYVNSYTLSIRTLYFLETSPFLQLLFRKRLNCIRVGVTISGKDNSVATALHAPKIESCMPSATALQ